jgi:hypothetical protein
MYTRVSTVNDQPIYSSKGNFRNLWQKYHIFRDRVELNTHLLGRFVINFEDLDRVEIRKSNLSQWGAFFRGKVPFVMGVKLDLSDFYENLGIYKNKGFVKLFVVIPDDLKVFKQYLENALNDFRKRNRGRVTSP